MKNSNVIQVNVQLDTLKLTSHIAEVKTQFHGLGKDIGQIGKTIAATFNASDDGISNTSTILTELRENLSAVTEQLEVLNFTMSSIAPATDNSFVSIVDSFNTLADGREKLEGISEAINKGFAFIENKEDMPFDIFKALFPDTVKINDKINKKIASIFGVIQESMITNSPILGSTATTMLQPVMDAFKSFGSWINGLGPIWVTAIIVALVLLIQNWDSVVATVQNGCNFLHNALANFDMFFQNVFSKDWTEQFGAMGHTLNAFFAGVKNKWEAIKKVFSGIIDFVSGIFAGDWGKAWNGICDIVAGVWEALLSTITSPINNFIGHINRFLDSLSTGINHLISLLNGLSFDIPNWSIFGDLAGQTFGLHLNYVSTPQIPYLAKGAVLPANKPFLAMVGDQKHGTNVEAPLATIQEAVALVMDDQLAGMMAGFEAVVRAIQEKDNSYRFYEALTGRAVRVS